MREAVNRQAKSAGISKSRPIPPLPDSTIAAGGIWPPVEGRTFLKQIHASKALCKSTRNGDWLIKAGTWKLLSYRQEAFSDYGVAVQRLLQYVHACQALQGKLSARRGFAVMANGDNAGWRLWHLVATEPTLSTRLRSAFRPQAAEKIAAKLAAAAEDFRSAVETLRQADIVLPLQLDTVGYREGRPLYTGFMPDASISGGMRSSQTTAKHIEAAFRHVVDRLNSRGYAPLPDIMTELRKIKETRPSPDDGQIDALLTLFETGSAH